LAVSALDVVNSYYKACNEGGDLSGVPLADDVKFTGPLATVKGAFSSAPTPPSAET
jgi:hypothetical protein